MNPFTHYSSSNQSQWSEARKVSVEEPSIFTFENYGDDYEESFTSTSHRDSNTSSYFSNQHDLSLISHPLRNSSFSSSFISNQSSFLNNSIDDLMKFGPSKFAASIVDTNEQFIEGSPRNQTIEITAMTYDRYIELATRGLVLGAIQELHQTQKDSRNKSLVVNDLSSCEGSDCEFQENDKFCGKSENEYLSESLYDGTPFHFLKRAEEMQEENVQEDLLLF